MAATITRTTTFPSGNVPDGADIDSEIQNVVNTINNLDNKTIGFTGLLIGSGNLVFNPTTAGILGTTTNNNTTAGNVGEYVSATGSAVNFPATGTLGDFASISLTAGDWDIAYLLDAYRNSGTGWSDVEIAITTTAGNNATGETRGINYVIIQNQAAADFSFSDIFLVIPSYRVSIASTTTYYAKFTAAYTGGQPQAYGRISARRTR